MRSAGLLLLLVAVTFAANTAVRTLLPSTIPGAACLDGSAPAYYFAAGWGDGANKWFIFHEGGGWCTSMADCYSRSKTRLGSSKSYPATEDLGGGYFSNQQNVNPVMWNWNKVYMPYCDGASFAGNNATVQRYNNENLYFRGFLNLQAVHKDLWTNRGLSKATESVISGCSAGGLATFLHVDWWAANLPRGSKVRGMPDSGFFLDWNAPSNGPKYGHDMRWVYQAQACQSGVNQKCLAANKGQEANCFFAEHTSPHIETPIFPLQSEYDSWQAGNILGSKNAAELNNFGTVLTRRFVDNLLKKNDKHGCFLDSCFHHCGEWDEIVINDLDQGRAFERWYHSDKGTHIQAKSYPCDKCCHRGDPLLAEIKAAW